VSDDAPENTYAQVKVNGKVVATLYSGGSATLTNGAAAVIDNLKDPERLFGPNLAQWRADAYAKALGGTVEKAGTAISQSQWKPHTDAEISYTRAARTGARRSFCRWTEAQGRSLWFVDSAAAECGFFSVTPADPVEQTLIVPVNLSLPSVFRKPDTSSSHARAGGPWRR
jgi:hypothetical protein